MSRLQKGSWRTSRCPLQNLWVTVAILAWGSMLAAGVYGMIGLTGKAEAWRLFRYLPGEYYRKVETMSMGKLTMKVMGWWER